MKKLLVLTGFLALALSASAAAQTCPADRAAKDGFSPFEEFHHVMAPAWHEAYPAEDYDALFAAAPKFVECFHAVAEMDPIHKSSGRKEQFIEARKELGDIVEAYAEAAASEDKEKVYALMPRLHDAFEHAASTLLPVHYPEFEGMVITLNLILETHLPKDNEAGVVGSTETLEMKMKQLNSESLPEELVEHKEPIMAEFEAMAADVSKMKQCCDNKDMDGYREHAALLDKRVKKFIETYI